MIRISDDKEFFIAPGSWSFKMKPAPERTFRRNKADWIAPNHEANRRFLLSNFRDSDFTPLALEEVKKTAAAMVVPPEPKWPEGGEFPLLPHQTRALHKAWGKAQFAFFHGMGSGKTRTMLELWRGMFESGMITEAWAIVPNSLIDNWLEQIRKWTPELEDKIKIYGILSLSAGKLAIDLAGRSHPKLAVAVDESQKIKESKATRTKSVFTIGKFCGYRYIMTGTSVTKGIEDLYSQFFFLNPDIIGHRSFFTFRNRYCMMGGFERKKIIGYINSNELMDLLAEWCDVVPDPVDLPDMVPEDRRVPLSDEQKMLMKELKSQMQTEFSGHSLSIANVLTYYTRAAQIMGGFFPTDNGYVRLSSIPRLDELMDIMKSTDHKVVIFCRFKPEQDIILDSLQKAGYNAACIKSGDPTLQDQVNSFQTDPDVRAIVATYAMGSVGFTLTAGRILVKYTGTFNYEDEAQSEFRIRRIGQKFETKGIRIMSNSPLDRRMKEIAEGKFNIAQFVQDSLRNPADLIKLLD